jgi:hypothetical protein
VKPWKPVTVIVEPPFEPARRVTLSGLAVRVKSWTVKATVAEWERPLPVPFTVTV